MIVGFNPYKQALAGWSFWGKGIEQQRRVSFAMRQAFGTSTQRVAPAQKPKPKSKLKQAAFSTARKSSRADTKSVKSAGEKPKGIPNKRVKRTPSKPPAMPEALPNGRDLT